MKAILKSILEKLLISIVIDNIKGILKKKKTHELSYSSTASCTVISQTIDKNNIVTCIYKWDEHKNKKNIL